VQGLRALDMLLYSINKGNLDTYLFVYLVNNTQSVTNNVIIIIMLLHVRE